ncbi:glycosyltransferase family 4 protein [Clostridium hydrogenum]|uniref:glycosyltransferase family 4 protein n=1 Tax=Clostridium hydrogenum TaxID=2855764 RepID=UPI001F3A9FA2|nr:glycosyltransferase family 4 protein [Clostridium hydrogenum]
MKILYITAQTPYGDGEQFIPPEIIEMMNKGNEIIVVPLRPNRDLAKGGETRQIAKYTKYVPLINVKVVLCAAAVLFKHPIKYFKILGNILSNSGSVLKVFKNLLLLGKGLVIADIAKENNVEHIHAHWASTPSTAAFIASYMSGIEYSFTSHRWDIAENNMLRKKAETAKFIRVIDDPGFKEMVGFIGEANKEKCHKIHVGVQIADAEVKPKKKRDYFYIVTPANFVEKKGHKYLIEAIEKLVKMGYSIKCSFYGSGPLEKQLIDNIEKLGMSDSIKVCGKIAHDDLLKMYLEGEVDCVALPSIVTADGEKEGIPVSLMEAMAYNIPAVSTYTGGIPELLGEDCGVLVHEKNIDELVEGLKKLIDDDGYRKTVEVNGYKRVYDEFYISSVVTKMLKLMKD